MRGAGKLLCVLTQHSLEGSDAGRQAEALERALHTLPSRFKAWGKRNPCRCGNLRHGVALLCGFVTPSLAAQGGQRLLPYFNISRDIPCILAPWSLDCKPIGSIGEISFSAFWPCLPYAASY